MYSIRHIANSSFIGNSIQEAVDWMQDLLKTTRPLAERTLFSMIVDKKINETEHGFVIFPDKDDLENHHHKEPFKRHAAIKLFGNTGQYRFNRTRWLKDRNFILKKLQHLDDIGGYLNPRDATLISDVGDEQKAIDDFSEQN